MTLNETSQKQKDKYHLIARAPGAAKVRDRWQGGCPGAGGEEEEDGGAVNGWEHSLSWGRCQSSGDGWWGRVHSNLNVFDAIELYT